MTPAGLIAVCYTPRVTAQPSDTASQRPKKARVYAPVREIATAAAAKDTRASVARSARSDVRAMALFALDGVVYALAIWTILRVDSLAVKGALALVPGTLFGTRLLVLAHDAGHGSLARSAWLNALLGRLAFLPALIPFALWQNNHNRLHHGFTNIRPNDINFTPITHAEYVAMPAVRRALERAYRSGFAFPIWWYCAFYLPYFIFPTRARIGRFRAVYFADWALLAAYVGGAVALAGNGVNAFCILFLPSLGVGVLLSFSGYVQHTHPAIPWFDRASPWSYEEHQRQVTPDPGFPRWFNAFFHDVFEHAIHHVDMRVPVYRLGEGQRALLASEEGRQIVRYRFSLAAYVDIARRCKLYDYERRAWTDFAGNVTSPEQESTPR